VLHEACRLAQAWRIERGWPVRIAVSVSPRQLLDLGFVDNVREAFRATGLPPGRLMLEITESLVLRTSRPPPNCSTASSSSMSASPWTTSGQAIPR
jgi:EAL domain-containing protein (putative c-di-GMP-specific phosphodiesterase class I)